MQSMLSAIYPMLKADFALDYWQIGMMTLAFQGTASLLQPAIGIFMKDDRRHTFTDAVNALVGMGLEAYRQQKPQTTPMRAQG